MEFVHSRERDRIADVIKSVAGKNSDFQYFQEKDAKSNISSRARVRAFRCDFPSRRIMSSRKRIFHSALEIHSLYALVLQSYYQDTSFLHALLTISLYLASKALTVASHSPVLNICYRLFSFFYLYLTFIHLPLWCQLLKHIKLTFALGCNVTSILLQQIKDKCTLIAIPDLNRLIVHERGHENLSATFWIISLLATESCKHVNWVIDNVNWIRSVALQISSCIL